MGNGSHRQGPGAVVKRSLTHGTAALAGLALGALITGGDEGNPIVPPLVDHLAAEEGFRPSWYTDTRGVPTIGYGFTNLTAPEGQCVLAIRASTVLSDLSDLWEPFEGRPDSVKVALADMGYQLGVAGLLRFDTFLRLVAADSLEAAIEDDQHTAWAAQTPARAANVARLFRSVNP